MGIRLGYHPRALLKENGRIREMGHNVGKLSGWKCALEGKSGTQASSPLSFCFLVDIK
jgi:hypothetical protein